MTARITQQQLESYLWGAAVLLRGTIDAGDYKQFIMPLLFYKRLCDVYDEETEIALAESGGDVDFAAFPENHRFQILPDAHWREVRKAARDVGQVLQAGMRAIETANPDKLYGIFGDAQWTNKDRLSDAMLRDLIEHFSSLDLTIANLPEDELGNGYEYLIKKFADDSGHTAAEFYTNRTVVHLMTELLEPQPGETIYDPTCGSGGMLLSAIAHLRSRGLEWRNVRLYGQERNLMTSSIARMNCFLHGIEDFHIVRGDTLSAPKFVEGDRLQRFDVVLANPPYSIKQWDRSAFAADPWGRNVFGTPPQGRADYAFWQHILASLDPETGRCAILFPHGVLFRQEEAEMRRKLIEADLIECVLGLGPNLFYNSAMEACVVICRTRKPKERQGKILFINAVNEVTRERTQSFLTDEHIEHIVAVYQEFKDESGFAKVASSDEIRKNDHSLKIDLYVAAPASNNGSIVTAEQTGELADTFRAWRASRVQMHEALSALLPDLQYGNRPSDQILLKSLAGIQKQFDRSTWERVRFGDVVTFVKETFDPNSSELDRYIAGEHMDSENVHLRRWGTVGDGYLGPAFIRRFRKGQVLYGSRRTYLKKVAYAEFDGITANTTFVLEAVEGKLYQPLLPWIMLSERFTEHSIRESKGSTNPYINWPDIAKFEFDLPPLDQQRRIAEVLWAVDDISCCIEKLQNSIGRKIQADRDNFFNDAMRGQVKRVGELCEVQLGKMLSPKSKRGNFPYPYLGNKNVQWGHFDLSTVQTMDFSPDELEKFKLQTGDLLVCEGGEVGRSAIWNGEIDNCCYQKALHRLRPLDGSVSAEYMLEFMFWANSHGLFSSLTGHSTIAHLTAIKLKELAVPVVNRIDEEAFLTKMRSMNDILKAILSHREQAILLRSALIQHLIGGIL